MMIFLGVSSRNTVPGALCGPGAGIGTPGVGTAGSLAFSGSLCPSSPLLAQHLGPHPCGSSRSTHVRTRRRPARTGVQSCCHRRAWVPAHPALGECGQTGGSQVHGSGQDMEGCWAGTPDLSAAPLKGGVGCGVTRIRGVVSRGSMCCPRRGGDRRSGLDPDPAASWSLSGLRWLVLHTGPREGDLPGGRVRSGPGGPGFPWQAAAHVALSREGAVGGSEAALTGPGFGRPLGVALPPLSLHLLPAKSGPHVCSAPAAAQD